MGRDFRELLSRQAVVFDGAMGTRLYEKGIFLNRCFDELNLSSPDLVEQIHDEYVAVGLDVIETNTFGANRVKLEKHAMGDLVEAINVAGARIARKAPGENVLVAGAIGPLGIRIEPWGPTSVESAGWRGVNVSPAIALEMQALRTNSGSQPATRLAA